MAKQKEQNDVREGACGCGEKHNGHFEYWALHRHAFWVEGENIRLREQVSELMAEIAMLQGLLRKDKYDRVLKMRTPHEHKKNACI
jgi:hypothetical protein